MKKCMILLLATILCFQPLFSENRVSPDSTPIRAKAAKESSYDAVALSMVAWGVGMAVVIGVLAATLNKGSSSSHSH